ncbi:hypothetical protein ROZALSC1DRAFT_26580, partial [Rozella allomycis CSF55]
MSVFINRINDPVAFSIGLLLSKTIVGSRKPQEDTEDVADGNVPYKITGTVVEKHNEDDFCERKEFMPPTNFKILKEPTDASLKDVLMESDRPKIFICISSVITWAKTKIDAEEVDAILAEEDFRKRKAHPNFKDHLNLEKNISRCGKKGPLKTYRAWHTVEPLKCYGEGTNFIPMIYLQDLVQIVLEVIETKPASHYVVAVDDSKITLLEILQYKMAIADNLGNGTVNVTPKEEALLEKHFEQKDYDMLMMNLKIDAGNGFVENVGQLIKEYKTHWNLWPVKIFIHGPPCSGKTKFSKLLSLEYKINYLNIDEVVKEHVSNLVTINRHKVTSPPKDGIDGADDQRDAAREELEEYKNALIKNDQKIPSEYLKLYSPSVKNQGYVLDGFPTTNEEASLLFQGTFDEDENKEESNIPQYDKLSCPEHVIHLDATDDYVKKNAMNQGASLEEHVNSSLEKYRLNNTDETTLLNFFDEREIAVLNVEMSKYGSDTDIFNALKKFIGKAHNYGPTLDEIIEIRRKEEEEKSKMEEEAKKHKEKLEKEENERQSKAVAEWNSRLEDIRRQEKEVLEAQSVPLRHYLMKNVMPTLTSALIEVCKADYLFKVNP